MVRQISVVLGIGLVILWITELNMNITPWLTWFDLAAGICAFVIAGILDERSPQNVRVAAPIALSLGLFALWIISLEASGAPVWQPWWNFGFACAFLLTGLAATVAETRLRGQTSYYGRLEYGRPTGYDYGRPFGVGHHMSSFNHDFGMPGALTTQRPPRGYQRSDARIMEDIYDRLSDQFHIDATEIRVTVENGIVFLRGAVNSRRDGRIAEDMAESVKGVKDVKNELENKLTTPVTPVRAA